MSQNKILKFGYEDTDKSIEIDLYGLVFKINNLNNIDKLKDLDRNSENAVESQIKALLGENAIERINEKRRKDGKEELDIQIELAILGCIMQAYSKEMVKGFTNKIDEAGKEINGDLNRYNKKGTREQRRYNKYSNRNYRRY